jgi:hypothetical protein
MRRINPYKMFNGSFIPEWLMPRKEISPGAKLCYSRLARYAGKDGKCNPKIETLAGALGVSDRQCSSYLSELKEHDLIEAHRLGLGKANQYFFMQHKWMGIGEKHPSDTRDTSTQDMKDTATQEVKDTSDQDMKDTATPYNKDLRESVEESQVKESVATNIDDDLPGTCEYISEATEVANLLLDNICYWDPTHRYKKKDKAPKSWILEIERAMRIDGRTQEQLEFIIEYLFTQSSEAATFWAPNIHSGKKLRSKFDKIKNQIKKEQNGHKKTNITAMVDSVYK